MSAIERVSLGEIATLQAGVGFPLELQGRSFGEYPVAKVGDISRVGRSGDAVLRSADHFVTRDDLSRLRVQPIPEGSVLFAKIGEAIRQNHRVIAGRPLLIDNNAMAAIPTDRIDARYLYHFLCTVDFYRLASSTTVPAVRKSELTKILVPLPPLPEQRRIAEILDKADALRTKRRAALAQIDTLAQSIFLDMFGDPTTNPKHWPTLFLGDAAEFYAGSTLPVGVPFDDQANGYLLLKVSDMNLPGNEQYIVTSQYWSAAPGADACTCPEGSIVIPKRGGAIGTNKKRITTRVSILDPNLMAIFPKPDKLELAFLHAWFARLDLSSIASGTSVPQLNKRDLAPLRIANPPLDLQRQFARRVSVIGEMKARHSEALQRSNSLFASLQHRAFRGEL